MNREIFYQCRPAETSRLQPLVISSCWGGQRSSKPSPQQMLLWKSSRHESSSKMQHCLGYSSIVITCHRGFADVEIELNSIGCSLSRPSCQVVIVLICPCFSLQHLSPLRQHLKIVKEHSKTFKGAAACYPWFGCFMMLPSGNTSDISNLPSGASNDKSR